MLQLTCFPQPTSVTSDPSRTTRACPRGSVNSPTGTSSTEERYLQICEGKMEVEIIRRKTGGAGRARESEHADVHPQQSPEDGVPARRRAGLGPVTVGIRDGGTRREKGRGGPPLLGGTAGKREGAGLEKAANDWSGWRMGSCGPATAQVL